jgi:hypothetical protein
VICSFFDRQDDDNRLNGTTINNQKELLALLESFASKAPFFCELIGENGFNLLLGIGPCGCAQYSASNGSPPYLMAVGSTTDDVKGHIEFMSGNTPTPVSKRYALSVDVVREIAIAFQETGRPSNGVSWEEV